MKFVSKRISNYELKANDRDHECFTNSEVAADWHEQIAPQDTLY